MERRRGNRRRTKWDRVQGWDLTGSLEQGWPGGVGCSGPHGHIVKTTIFGPGGRAL